MVVQGTRNRNNVHRSRSVDGIDGRGERNRRIRREIDSPEMSMDQSDGSQECVLPLGKRRQENRQEVASWRSQQDHQTGPIRNIVRPSPNLRKTYQRAISAEELSFGERTPTSVLSNNGVIQRRLLRRRSFGGLEPSAESEMPGELTPLQIPRNYKRCEVVMAEIVGKLRGDNHAKDVIPSERFCPLDHAISHCGPLVSDRQNDPKPIIERSVSSSRIKRRGSTGHLKDTNARITHSMEGRRFLPSSISVSNHERSTGVKLLSVQRKKHQQDMPKPSQDKKGLLLQEKESTDRTTPRERSNNSDSRRDMVVRGKQKSSSLQLQREGSYASDANIGREKHADQSPIKNGDIPLTVQYVATDALRTSDRRRRERSLQRNSSGPLVKPLPATMNGLATAVAKEDLFLIWLKKQNCNNNMHCDARISRELSGNSIDSNERQPRTTTLSDRRAMRQVRRRNSQAT